MGAIGGSVFHGIKGFRNAPSVSNFKVSCCKNDNMSHVYENKAFPDIV